MLRVYRPLSYLSCRFSTHFAAMYVVSQVACFCYPFYRTFSLRGGSRGRVQGVRTLPPRDDLRFSNTTGILQKNRTMWFIGVEVEQETSAPPPKKNPGSAPEPYPGLTAVYKQAHLCSRIRVQTADNSGIWTKLISGY